MIEQRINNLRQILNQHKFSGYIVPTTDEYLSEYTPEYAKRLEYITGFTGSNGLAIILNDTVLFFTDGRYLNQCSKQLDGSLFEVFDLQLLKTFNWSKYIDSEATIAYDPQLFTTQSLQNFSNTQLHAHPKNLIDIVWEDQPAKPKSDIFDYPIKYAGEDYKQKIEKCREVLKLNKAQALVITDSASVCWLLNIRAHDVEFSPLLLANIILTEEQVYLFVDKNRADKSLHQRATMLLEEKLPSIIAELHGTILFDESQASSYISSLIKSKDHKHIKNPCSLWKACKNDAEIKYMHDGHIQDAVAVCEMLSLIEQEDIRALSEYDLGKQLTALRAKGDGYMFDSFPTICGYQSNGAIIHYKANQDSAKKITGEGLLLIDSGGQYMGATTDITRTISIGNPIPEYRKYYTRVLKGHIALACSVFPKNRVTGAHLDILARQHLWKHGDDYAHGTGHGVGSFLSVHEGPQNISLAGFGAILSKGMVVSNEPGYYVPEKFGIRIENMMYVTDANAPDFLRFQMLTLVPYDKNLIEIDMLTKDEVEYLQAYYLSIEEKILPLLSKKAQTWLKDQISFH